MTQQHSPATDNRNDSRHDSSRESAEDRRLLDAVALWLRAPSWHLGFPALLEARMEADQGPQRQRQLVLGGLMSLLVFDLFLINDLYTRPEVFGVALLGRLGLMTPYGLLVLALVHRGLPPRWRERLMASTGVAAMGVACWIFRHTESPDAAYDPFVFSLVLMATNITYPLRFVAAAVSSALALVLCAAGIWGHVLMPMAASSFALGLMLGTAVFTVLAAYRVERASRVSYLLLLQEELRTRSAQRQAEAYALISQTDALTQLANRRAFDTALQARWAAACANHHASEPGLALLMIDVDHFKRYNDHLGHPAGDECLRRVAAAMRDSTRPGDLLARTGGEEFALLLGEGDLHTAAALAGRLCRTVEALALPHDGREGQQVVTVSVGVAWTRPAADQDAADLLDEADQQLYVAKRQGRNRWACADPGVAVPGS
jgi:diguanylate cyclase (GGDEF)-like protein